MEIEEFVVGTEIVLLTRDKTSQMGKYRRFAGVKITSAQSSNNSNLYFQLRKILNNYYTNNRR